MFYMRINHLSRKRTLSSSTYKSNSSYRIRFFLVIKENKKDGKAYQADKTRD